LFAAAPELRLAYEIGELRKARASGRIRLVIGAAGIALPGWTATNIGLLNLLKPETWRAWLDENSVEAMLAEHVWGHLDEAEGHVAAHTCFRFLAPGGRLRIAVPDALMPDPAYQENCKIGGRNDHKHLYDYRSLSAVLSAAGFAVRLLEYFDENGKLHLNDWSREDGHIGRSVKFDKRNQDGVIRFTSLIVDGIKPKPEETQRRPSTPQPGS
jgi:predicted SAM-dependent methyltransferase